MNETDLISLNSQNSGEDVMEILRNSASLTLDIDQYTQSNSIETDPQVVNYYKVRNSSSPEAKFSMMCSTLRQFLWKSNYWS